MAAAVTSAGELLELLGLSPQDVALAPDAAGFPLRVLRGFVVHANHAQEINADVAAALTAIRDSGATVLNQSVSLAGVNDSAAAQVALSERLLSAGTLPYYIHMLDRVRGAAHFEVDETRARQILAEVATRLPGYLAPKLVRETAGEPAKRTLAAGWPGP